MTITPMGVSCSESEYAESKTDVEDGSMGNTSNIVQVLKDIGMEMDVKCRAQPLPDSLSSPSVALTFENGGVRVSANSVSDFSVVFNFQAESRLQSRSSADSRILRSRTTPVINENDKEPPLDVKDANVNASETQSHEQSVGDVSTEEEQEVKESHGGPGLKKFDQDTKHSLSNDLPVGDDSTKHRIQELSEQDVKDSSCIQVTAPQVSSSSESTPLMSHATGQVQGSPLSLPEALKKGTDIQAKIHTPATTATSSVSLGALHRAQLKELKANIHINRSDPNTPSSFLNVLDNIETCIDLLEKLSQPTKPLVTHLTSQIGVVKQEEKQTPPKTSQGGNEQTNVLVPEKLIAQAGIGIMNSMPSPASGFLSKATNSATAFPKSQVAPQSFEAQSTPNPLRLPGLSSTNWNRGMEKGNTTSGPLLPSHSQTTSAPTFQTKSNNFNSVSPFKLPAFSNVTSLPSISFPKPIKTPGPFAKPPNAWGSNPINYDSSSTGLLYQHLSEYIRATLEEFTPPCESNPTPECPNGIEFIQCISAMPVNQQLSHEELRLRAYTVQQTKFGEANTLAATVTA